MKFFFNKTIKFEEYWSKIQPFSVLYNDFIIKLLKKFFNKNKFFLHFTKNLKKNFKENLYYELSDILDSHIYNILQSYKKNKFIKNKDINFFYRDFLKGRQKKLSRELKKNINITIKNWITNNNELIRRIYKDQKQINDYFFINSNVKDIKFNIGDKHNNHKSVTLIKFKNNKKVLYKPRNAEIDLNYNKFIEFINKALNEKIRTVKVINKKEYSWHEYIAEDKSDNNVYKNFGKLLSIAYLLKITDLHQENIVVNKNHPIPVDLESILVFRKSFFKQFNSKSEEKIFNIIEDSLITTGILPSPILINNKLNFRGGVYFNEALIKEKIIWKNKKNMNIFPLKKNKLVKKNNNTNEKILIKKNDRKNIKNSFLNFNKNLKKLKNNNKFKSLIKNINNSEVRFIFRNTYLYYLLIKKIRFLESDKLYLKKILSKIYDGDLNTNQKKLINAEINQLTNLDIPYFKSKKNKVYINNNKFIKLPLKKDYQKIYQKKSLEFQERIINYKLQIKSKIKIKDKTIEKKILNIISKNEVFSKNSYSWINKNFNHELSDLGNANDNIYNGSLGIIIFLAAYYKTTNNKKILKIINSKINEIFKKNKNYLKNNKSGILDGIGSYIYFLILISNLLNRKYDKKFLPYLLNEINLQKIINNNDLDLIDGNSGLLLSLVRYYEKFKCISSFKTLNDYGMKIFEAIKYKFDNKKNDFLPGFSHGIAGIAYALTAFNFYIKNKNINNFILILLKFENKNFYSNKNKNWINTYQRKKFYHDHNQTSWCHGSLGVGLGRVGIYRYANNELLKNIAKKDIKNSINSNILNIKNVKNFTLCCGQLSYFTLLDYSFKDQKRIKIKLKSKFIKDLKNELNFNIYDFNNSFFYGASGIGYYYLKIIKNIKLPDISLLEI